MPRLTRDQQDARRRHILDAAEACFAREGFHRTTMQAICKEAGISAGALYIYFGSKEELSAGLTDRDRAEVVSHFQKLATAGDFIAGLAELLRALVIEQPARKTALFMEISAESVRNARVREAVLCCDAAIRATLGELIARAAAEGRIAPRLPSERIVESLEVIAHGLFWRKAIDPGFDARAFAPTAMALIGDLFEPPAPAAAPAPSTPAMIGVA